MRRRPSDPPGVTTRVSSSVSLPSRPGSPLRVRLARDGTQPGAGVLHTNGVSGLLRPSIAPPQAAEQRISVGRTGHSVLSAPYTLLCRQLLHVAVKIVRLWFGEGGGDGSAVARRGLRCVVGPPTRSPFVGRFGEQRPLRAGWPTTKTRCPGQKSTADSRGSGRRRRRRRIGRRRQ